ncbi:HD family phosphohydrolase [Candidatus Neomarinimicrobiota bacterium]
MKPLRSYGINRGANSEITNPATRRIYRAVIFIATAIVITFLYPVGDQFEYRYDLNQIAPEAIIAPFNFPILKSQDELVRERANASAAIPLLFHPQPEVLTEQLGGIEELFDKASALRRTVRFLSESRDRAYRYQYDANYATVQAEVVRDSLVVERLKDEFVQIFPLDIESNYWSEFFAGVTDSGRTLSYPQLQRNIERITRDILTEGVLELSKSQLGEVPVSVSSTGVEEIVDLKFLMDLDEAWAKAKTRLQARYPADRLTENFTGSAMLVYFIRSNLAYDAETTLRRQQEAVDRVPVSKGIVLENERIVDANTRVTEDVKEKLNSLAAAKSRQLASSGGIQLWLPRIGMFMITVALLTFFLAWLYVFRPAWYKQTRILLLTNLLFVTIMAAASFFYVRLDLSEYLIPFTVAAMAFTILFDARTSIIASVALALMLGFMVGNKVDFVLVNTIVGSASIYAVRQLRRRRQIFVAIIYIVTTYALAITAIEFLKYTTISKLGIHLFYAGINGILSPIMVYGLIGLLEVIFGITTNLTLLELSDFNHPLLRRLSREANGTFSHSIVVGNLVEAAANTIGANSLLCRVGAYYHDIGKLARPEYFIENQFRSENPHDSIAPNLSAKVVASHVKEGLRLAREYGLPSTVADFIPMHHGTARIEYFYKRALDEAGPDEQVKEENFRYSGPRPNTKETGLLMLCEAIEAATRSIKKPTLGNLQQMIEMIIKLRIDDGQLDACPLTMQDLNTIKGDPKTGTGIISVLQGIYHVRISYPSTEQKMAEETLAMAEVSQETVFEGTPTE